jgi:hypothetical protein
VTLAFPAAVFLVRRGVVAMQTLDAGFPSAEYLSARLEIDGEEQPDSRAAASPLARAQSTYEELERRLSGEPGIAAVTFTSRLPRTAHSQRRLEIDGAGPAISPAERGHRVSSVSVAVNYFDALDARVVAGRTFARGDFGTAPDPVIVNDSFVQRVLQGRNAIGRRLRYLRDDRRQTGAAETQELWHEIVGVVPDLGTIRDDPHDLAAVYHASAPGAALPMHIALHVRGEAQAFSSRLRAIAAQVDPTLRLYDVTPLDRVGGGMWNEFDFLSRILMMTSGLAILLSLSGIYAAVSFAVSRRKREIGIRVALGAKPRSVVAAILRRPLSQVALGVIAGTTVVSALVQAMSSSGLSLVGAALVAGYAVFMMGVCLLACVVPIMRALRIEATEALRTDG